MDNQKQSTDINRLQGVITGMDSLSEEGFSEITTIARLTIKALEIGPCDNHMDDVLNVLRIIWSKAEDIQNAINCQAEDVGCNYISETTERKIKEAMEAGSHD